MIVYTIVILCTSFVFLTGTIFWIISIFNNRMRNPLLSYVAYLFWPISLIFIAILTYFNNRYHSRKNFF